MILKRLDEVKREYPIYGCPFRLTNPVNDIRKAQKYLDEDHKGMLDIFNRDTDEYGDNDPIIDWRWYLKDDTSGYFLYQTYRNLSDVEIENLGDATLGQASDGLGEGFEQQNFAHYEIKHNEGSYDDEYEDIIVASFNWEDHIHGYPIKLMDPSYSRYL